MPIIEKSDLARQDARTKATADRAKKTSGQDSQIPPYTLTNGVLRKHVAAVHTSGELGLLERKLVNILLLNAYDSLNSPLLHSMPTRYLFYMLGWESSKNVQDLKDALQKLQKTQVAFNLMRDGEEVWQSMSLLSFVEITGSRDQGSCNYRYVPELAEKLHDPAVFANINLGVQRAFRGGYSLTLYENAVRFKNVRSTGWMNLDKFRVIMGADAPMYDDFKRLSSFVIKKAVEEINRISDIKLTPEYQRVGRKVVGVRFLIEDNPQQSLLGPHPLEEENLASIRESDTFKSLRSHGISERLALTYMQQDPEQARLAVEEAEKRDKKGQIKTSTGAYIKTLITEEADLKGTAYTSRKNAEWAASVKAKKLERDKLKYDELRVDFRLKIAAAALKQLTPEDVAGHAAEYSQVAGIEESKFNKRAGKFADSVMNANFKNWLRAKLVPEFVEQEFEQFALEKGFDASPFQANH